MSKVRFLPKMPVFVADVLTSMRWQRMTAEQRGAYMHLLMLQWQEGGLPDDDQALLDLGKLVGPPAQHRILLDAFEVCADGMRRNDKNQRVRAEAEAWCEAQAGKASLGGRAKAEKERAARSLPEVCPDPARGHASGMPGAASGHAPSMPQSAPLTLTLTPTLTLNASTASLRSAGADPAGAGPAPAHQAGSEIVELKPAKSKRPRKPRKPAEGPQPDAIRKWEQTWFEARGTPWVWTPKEATSVARCLALAKGDLVDYGARVDRMLFDPPDEWTAQNAAPSLLADRWNQIAVRTVGRAEARMHADMRAGVEAAKELERSGFFDQFDENGRLRA